MPSCGLCRACFKNDFRVTVAIAQGLNPLASCGPFDTTEQAAEKGLNLNRTPEKHPSGAKARHCFVTLTARLKSCPFKAEGFSAACEVVP
jgi:hypothetical protein